MSGISKNAKIMLEQLSAGCEKRAEELMSVREAEELWSNTDDSKRTNISFVDSDTVTLRSRGEQIVSRVYVRTTARIDDGVGWVLNNVVGSCMSCDVKFGGISRR